MLADALSRALVQSAYAVDVVPAPASRPTGAGGASYDLVILDIGLPGI
jgi:two-component system OmpR family response regulator